MLYIMRVIWLALLAIVYPPSFWQGVWHYAVIAGLWLAPEIRKMFEAYLAKVGLSGLENWHYYTFAAVLAVFTLAVQVARLTARKVSIINLRQTNYDGKYYCKITIKNDTTNHFKLLAQLKIKQDDGTTLSIGGRDRFVLLTSQRLYERFKWPEKEQSRTRFNLGEYEAKDLEFLILDEDLKKMSVYDELGEVDIPFGNHVFEIKVTGGGAPSTVSISMHDYDNVHYVELEMPRQGLKTPKHKLSFNHEIGFMEKKESWFDSLMKAILTRPPLTAEAAKPAKATRTSNEAPSEGSGGTRTPKGKSGAKSRKR